MGNWKPTFNIVRHENPNIPGIIANQSIVTTIAHDRFSGKPINLRIMIKALIGMGSFGRVYKTELLDSQEIVALKHCYHNSRYHQREVEILTKLQDHCNIVKLLMYSYVNLGNSPRCSLILVMEYMPMNLRSYIKRYRNNQQAQESIIYVRILSYQMFRALGYLHSLGICHRDIKPENILMDSQSMQLKLADFGSAKTLESQKPNLTYIGSRFYRAPELFAKYDRYDCSIDVWSAGCVLAEMLKGTPLFLSNKIHLEQLQHIINMLGTEGLDAAPTIRSACGNMSNIVRPNWSQLLNGFVPQDLAELLNRCLVYKSGDRILPMKACAHNAFDELRIMETLKCSMPNGLKAPPLFNFGDQELGSNEKLRMDLLPIHLNALELDIDEADVLF